MHGTILLRLFLTPVVTSVLWHLDLFKNLCSETEHGCYSTSAYPWAHGHRSTHHGKLPLKHGFCFFD